MEITVHSFAKIKIMIKMGIIHVTKMGIRSAFLTGMVTIVKPSVFQKTAKQRPTPVTITETKCAQVTGMGKVVIRIVRQISIQNISVIRKLEAKYVFKIGLMKIARNFVKSNLEEIIFVIPLPGKNDV